MTDTSIVIIGLPASGKTTFLAALWHLVTAREIPTVLTFASLGRGDNSHLNAIAARWREARIQERTAIGGNRLVKINLRNAHGVTVSVTFPDTAGEAYARMWEERECDRQILESVKSTGVMAFVHADTIRQPRWVVDDATVLQAMGIPVPDGGEVSWHPRLSPTQVQVVELLQLLQEPPLSTGARKLALMLSAWDKVIDEGLKPVDFLHTKLPLLSQYLRQNTTRWDSRVYGLSAQGGDYDSTEGTSPPENQANALRDLVRPSDRIRVFGVGPETHDLTEPLVWLMG
jgi:Double-GTPase 1